MSNPTVEAALQKLADNIKAGSDVEYSYVWPFDWQSLSLRYLPTAVVMRRLAVPQTWGWWAFGVSTRKWEAEIFIMLAKGTIQTFDEPSAKMEELSFGWAHTIADILAADMTLGGLVEFVGNGEQGASGQLFTYVIEHIQWRNDVYWGIHFFVPITQRITHEVTG